MADTEQFEQKGADYKPKRKKANTYDQTPKALYPVNVDDEHPTRPALVLSVYDKTATYDKKNPDAKYLDLIVGWNNEQGNISCSFNTQKLDKAKLKSVLDSIENNPNIVMEIKLRNVYEDELALMKPGRISISAVVRDADPNSKDKFSTLWFGNLDVRNQVITGSFGKKSRSDILNIFRRCTEKEDGHPTEMFLRVYRQKDSPFKAQIIANPAKYVPNYDKNKVWREEREAKKQAETKDVEF